MSQELEEDVQRAVEQLAEASSEDVILVSNDADELHQSESLANSVRELFRMAGVGDSQNIVELLSTSQLHPDAEDGSGHTPFLIAARYGHIDVMRVLLAEGARPSHRTINGNSAWMLAAAAGELRTLNYLMIEVAPTMKPKEVEMVLVNRNRDTVLMFAAMAGRADVVEYLIRVAESINVLWTQARPDVRMHPLSMFYTNNSGFNVIMCSCESGSRETFRHLIDALKRGAEASEQALKDVEIVDDSKRARDKDKDKDGKSDKQTNTKKKVSVSDVFALTAKEYISKYLNHTDVNGNTALHIACKYPTNEDVVYELLTLGADPLCHNASGQTPLMHWLNHGYKSGKAYNAMMERYNQAKAEAQAVIESLTLDDEMAPQGRGKGKGGSKGKGKQQQQQQQQQSKASSSKSASQPVAALSASPSPSSAPAPLATTEELKTVATPEQATALPTESTQPAVAAEVTRAAEGDSKKADREAPEAPEAPEVADNGNEAVEVSTTVQTEKSGEDIADKSTQDKVIDQVEPEEEPAAEQNDDDGEWTTVPTSKEKKAKHPSQLEPDRSTKKADNVPTSVSSKKQLQPVKKAHQSQAQQHSTAPKNSKTPQIDVAAAAAAVTGIVGNSPQLKPMKQPAGPAGRGPKAVTANASLTTATSKRATGDAPLQTSVQPSNQELVASSQAQDVETKVSGSPSKVLSPPSSNAFMQASPSRAFLGAASDTLSTPLIASATDLSRGSMNATTSSSVLFASPREGDSGFGLGFSYQPPAYGSSTSQLAALGSGVGNSFSSDTSLSFGGLAATAGFGLDNSYTRLGFMPPHIAPSPGQPTPLQKLLHRVDPRAEDLAILPAHVLGVGLNGLSEAQLECVESILETLLKKCRVAKETRSRQLVEELQNDLTEANDTIDSLTMRIRELESQLNTAADAAANAAAAAAIAAKALAEHEQEQQQRKQQ